ncbi:hypothetical protein wVul_1569 [Wolbachia endosymbiont of Armadillidium vulgare str. wVulC]|nr:hypothetical protein wVul_1569 [Wolbachia endosymbiont of Armadillidium vulgare str. wVulC]
MNVSACIDGLLRKKTIREELIQDIQKVYQVLIILLKLKGLMDKI